MNDYKELIENLKICEKDSRSLLNSFDQRNADAIRQAAEAVEQLVKERDAAIAALCNAVDDHCEICKHDGDEAFCERGCRFEWRGVQEVEHG